MRQKRSPVTKRPGCLTIIPHGTSVEDEKPTLVKPVYPEFGG